MIGLYLPGRSVVHRTPTLLKLLLLAVGVSLLAFMRGPVAVAVASTLLAALFALARVPLGVAWRQVAPVLWLLIVAVPLQALFAGWPEAGLMAARLIIAVALAALFTLTTTVSSVLAACEALLRPWGRFVDADRVGLLIALVIRCVPLVTDIVKEVAEARRARGQERSLVALAVPVVVRSLYAADAIGEALTARGFDD
ncbi:energy-coupling factor transporter transmembrane component T family protein [Cryobacterium tepidiphilum]|uniref:Energy-coupling factor transporter transmembrane protein EcfT n=1 Tax=Cryobacterium tepidiphilum TaxID=2486026 RepID=A0A3M8L158_9MICO|nr:energy-coupling factor transporter transmembrane protein EcfT [Cryobacterium tepidiphilum]RNE59287.1 energy-coupling factor transporter transmembrane protein EcfT [Cryobacterium tepidiphilum]